MTRILRFGYLLYYMTLGDYASAPARMGATRNSARNGLIYFPYYFRRIYPQPGLLKLR